MSLAIESEVIGARELSFVFHELLRGCLIRWWLKYESLEQLLVSFWPAPLQANSQIERCWVMHEQTSSSTRCCAAEEERRAKVNNGSGYNATSGGRRGEGTYGEVTAYRTNHCNGWSEQDT